jgi:hypothetical protein
MIKRIVERISEFGIGRTPVGSYFLLAVFGVVAIGCLTLYCNLMDLVPTWAIKIAGLYFAMYVYGVHMSKKDTEK